MNASILSAAAVAFVCVGAASPAPADDAAVASGLRLAREICANCHVVEPRPAKPPTLDPPAQSFAEIAARPEVTAASLATFLAEPHGESRRGAGMPPFLLSRAEVDSVVAYLLGLKPR